MAYENIKGTKVNESPALGVGVRPAGPARAVTTINPTRAGSTGRQTYEKMYRR
jgi:hypothetical protein